MSTLQPDGATSPLAAKSALVVGAGGLGCPAALALVEAGVGHVALMDDDVVELANLHRQVLYTEGDVGRDKLDAALDALGRVTRAGQRVEAVRTRLLPENARELVKRFDVVLEGADNYATKFLAADACFLERRPIVHGAAVRLRATVWSVSAGGRPCYRCLFEDIPDSAVGETCAEAGVMGPVVGFAGALMADLALSELEGRPRPALFAIDGASERVREVPMSARSGCPLCGREQSISRIDAVCYTGPDGAPRTVEGAES